MLTRLIAIVIAFSACPSRLNFRCCCLRPSLNSHVFYIYSCCSRIWRL